MTTQQLKVLLTVANLIVDTVGECGPYGAPGGVIYAALANFGCTLHQFEQIMGGLVSLGRLRRDGDLYFAAN